MEIKTCLCSEWDQTSVIESGLRWGPPSMVTSWCLNRLLPRHRLDVSHVRTCIFRSTKSSGWWIIIFYKASFQRVSMSFPCRLVGAWTCHIFDIILTILTLKLVFPRHRLDDMSLRRRRHDVWTCLFKGIVLKYTQCIRRLLPRHRL